MITRRMEDKLEELKSYFNTKFNEQEESLTKTFNNIITDLKKEITKEIQHGVSKQCKQLDSEKNNVKKNKWFNCENLILITNHATKS